jgi:hypothetical protein
MSIFNVIKDFFKYNPKEVFKHFFGAELDDLNEEIYQHQEYIRSLEEKKAKIVLRLHELAVN